MNGSDFAMNLTPAAIVRQAEATAARCGFTDFKLKGGVMRGAEQLEAADAIKKGFLPRVSPSILTAPGRLPRRSRSAAADAMCSPMRRIPAGPKMAIQGAR